MPTQKTRLVLQVVGLGALVVYLAAAFNVLPIIGTERITLALVFAIGPVAMMAVLGLYELLSTSRSVFLLRVGTTFLIVAFALFNLMLVVQQLVRVQFRQFRAEAGDAGAVALLDSVFKGTDLVQQGIDVSFDVFYCLGIIALSAVMYSEPAFGRLLGGFGAVSAAALLVLNVAAFPHPPANSGLVDLGPLTGLWWILVIIQTKRMAARLADGAREKKGAAQQRDEADEAQGGTRTVR